ncbi:retrotransposon protein, putative, ty1-copia subclass [Tanacetum coccineum]
MHGIGKKVNELHAMLKLHEQTMTKKDHALHVIRAGKVYDTGCGTHICNTTQGLRGSRKLKPRALSLYVGNGQRVTVEAIRSFHLCLPSGLVIVLNNFHYAPSITRGIISVSCLYDDGFVNRFVANTILVSRNNLVYFSVVPRDGIFEIDLSNSNTNDSSVYAVSNKRDKLNLDSALLWHCRLRHTSKKRIEKLQHDGLLNSTDLKAFQKCVSRMSGKMARKPYTHQVERAKDLLRLIHIDVCGPFRTMSRQGASYFITFTNDFSRYGYVYLLKHKHEVFETFKVFQKEVENQLGKTIELLRSDREGEYTSQEFLDHLKENEVISYRTPPYTPQHNGVSERRNRTLLDMVRSMMTQTTLPKSFWDYAPEIAARILNVVPTKKVEKIPYEVWHGQAPKPIPKASNGLFFLLPTREQKEDAHPSINTSSHHEEDDLEIDEPRSDIIPIRDLGEPAKYKAALLDPESDKWLDAMNVKMKSMNDNEVWDLVDLPPNGKTVHSKWLFQKKTDMDEAVHTYKAHLVAKGYTQTPWIDYEETFSPVIDIRAIRILIAIAAFYDYKIWCFAMKDLGEAAYTLGIKIYKDRSRRLISLCQSAYIEKILQRFHMENSKRGSIPMQEKLKLSKSQGASTPAKWKRMQNVPYASDNPGDLHWSVVKYILKYLRNTKDMFLVYEGDIKQELSVSCYTDARYLTDAEDLMSQNMYSF